MLIKSLITCINNQAKTFIFSGCITNIQYITVYISSVRFTISLCEFSLNMHTKNAWTSELNFIIFRRSLTHNYINRRAFFLIFYLTNTMVIPQHQILSNLIYIRTIILYDTFKNLQIKYRVFKIKCSQYPHFNAYIFINLYFN